MTSSLAARDVPSPREKEYGMVEVPPPPITAFWRKSSTSASPHGDCVQVTPTQGHVWVRDSKNPLGPALGLTREGWSAFLGSVRRDEFVLLQASGLSTVRRPFAIT
ncbi:MAG: DUF397 domain-containing protein [Pseudonocardiaceae bacterium]